MKLTREQWRQIGKRRRKHQHYKIIVTFTDGELFEKVYADKEKAEKYAARQDRSPAVKSTKIVRLN